MQCCMPLCENTSENFSTCGRITFHRLPSEPGLRAAWFRALGVQDSQLPDTAVVCSQHFLHDDICKTESGSRQLRSGAVPSTVLVCMTCLDTDSMMSPISQYNLKEAYEELTGHPLWDGGNLKQTLCVQCAQQLRDFSRFREQSLRARSLMMELLETHEVITIQHIKMIQHAKNTLKNKIVSVTLRPDSCDMNIVQENSDEDRQTGSEDPLCSVVIKTDGSEFFQWEAEDTQMIIEENADCVKGEFSIDQFLHEHAYSAHVCTQLHDERPHAASPHTAGTPLSARLETSNEAADTTQHSERALVTYTGLIHNRALDTDHSTNADLKSCVVKLYDILKYPQNAKIKVESLSQTLRAVSSHDNAHTACEDVHVAATHNEPAASVLSETEPATSGHSSRTRTFTYDVCERAFTRKDHFVRHMKSHTGEKPYACKICSYKFADNSHLVSHMRTHTGEKPYSCKTCSYKFTRKGDLIRHMRIHTGEKPFSCNICSYKSSIKGNLVTHMRIHTGEKPYSCKICSYRCKENSSLVRHMWRHTGEKKEKPCSCKICSYKCSQKSTLVIHMRTHTGEKPYSCETCSYKFTRKSDLIGHMRIHTGEKPFSCNICSYKSSKKGNLVTHMRIHTGEKPYSCRICSHKFADNSHLASHMRTHTCEKPYSCETCSYKFTRKGDLIRHMRIHTGEKPYSCNICSYKFSVMYNLVKHMRTHTGAH